MRRKGKSGKLSVSKGVSLLEGGKTIRGVGAGGSGGERGARNTRWDSSYNDTANALIEASEKSAVDATRREIIGI